MAINQPNEAGANTLMSNMNVLELRTQGDIRSPKMLLEYALPLINDTLPAVNSLEVFRLTRGGMVLWFGMDSPHDEGAFVPLDTDSLHQQAIIDHQVLSDTAQQITVAPLVNQKEVYALLVINSENTQDHEFIARIANDLGLLLYTQVMHRVLEQQIAITGKLSIASSLSQVATVIAETMLDSGQFVSVNSITYDNDTVVEGKIIATANQNEAFARELAIEIDTSTLILLVELLKTEGEVLVSDIMTESRFNEAGRQWLSQQQVKSIYLLPLWIDSQLSAFISVIDTQYVLELSDLEKELFHNIVHQAAIVIEKQNLLEQTQYKAQQLEQLTDFGQSLRAYLSLDEILNTTLDYCPTVLNATYTGIFLYDRQSNSIRENATYIHGDKKVNLDAPKLTEDENSIAIQAWTSHELIKFDDLHINWDLSHRYHRELQSLIAIPLSLAGVMLGVLEVGSAESYHFQDADVTTVRQISNQLAIALSNASAYSQSQRMARNKSQANEIIAQMQQQLDVNDILSVTVQELGKALGAKKARIRLGTMPSQATGDQS